ncbi:MAG: Flp pilus assembly complex ATPase component TadA [Streptococcaceae bacterium]|jgi:competence protein ComGA|nr:Flp pilus assembly complex ATPase component TadA [Streptococcaceae bacterium]
MRDLSNELLQAATEISASDLYILPYFDHYQVLLRNSFSRKKIADLSEEKASALISHFKFVAGMNVGEKRRTQLGSVLYEFSDQKRRLRLSTVGNYQGQESLVIRLLHDFNQNLEFWFQDDREAESLINSRGLYLFSGPVGSGKTSLMYQIALNKFADKQVVTIEDPVEVIEPNFLQLARNDIIGNSYDDLIKLSLRHMPDLVIVGEIRDEKTARAVIRASLTGFTVFSTVHAKSIPGVWARMREVGVNEAELENALRGVLYQRLLAGKGVIDCEKKDYSAHSPSKWNAKISQLEEKGILTVGEAEREKIDAR